MKRSLALAAVSLLTLSAFATPPAVPSVTSIAPGGGTVTGGDTVTIRVSDTLLQCAICSPPLYEAEVTFDGIPARSITATTDTIYAVTPPHAAGAVTVVVTSEGHSYGTASFAYYGFGGPILRSNYERVLVPLSLPGDGVPGAFGSLWTSELWVSNPTPYPVELFNDISCTIVCLDPPPGGGYPQLPANTFFKLSSLNLLGDYGFLYYAQKTYANDLSFALHVADVSRGADNAGTEIGVVRRARSAAPRSTFSTSPSMPCPALPCGCTTSTPTTPSRLT